MSTNPEEQGLPLNLAGGRGTGIPDLRLLLTMHATSQAAAPTARIVRESDLPVAAEENPERLTLIFTSNSIQQAVLQRVAGPFNAAVAALLSAGRESESAVYPVG